MYLRYGDSAGFHFIFDPFKQSGADALPLFGRLDVEPVYECLVEFNYPIFD